MNCNEVAEILNAERFGSIDDESQLELAVHARDCANCMAALMAQRAIESEKLPAVPGDLLERVLRAATHDDRARTSVGRLRIRRAAYALGIVMLGSAVYAAVTLWMAEPDAAPDASLVEQTSVPDMSSDGTGQPSASADNAATMLIDYVDSAEAEEHQHFTETLMSGGDLPDGEMFSLLKVAPRYPEAAAAAGLEGYAVVEFTVTERGDVAEPKIIDSSNVLFEQPSTDAALAFKYKPRVENGRPVSVGGIRNRIVYRLEQNASATPASRDSTKDSEDRTADAVQSRLFAESMVPALECLEAGDLRCVELELDEIRATQMLTPEQEAALWRIYGFVHHRQGNFERAIADYERAAAGVGGELGYWTVVPLMTAAHIYYDRAQYQQALDAAVEYLKAAPNPTVGDYIFVDELRRLGATVK